MNRKNITPHTQQPVERVITGHLPNTSEDLQVQACELYVLYPKTFDDVVSRPVGTVGTGVVAPGVVVPPVGVGTGTGTGTGTVVVGPGVGVGTGGAWSDTGGISWLR